MAPDELAQRYFLARILWWRNDLEQLDAVVIAELVKALKSANNEIREEIQRELYEVWDVYSKGINREKVKVWLAALVAATAAGVVNKVTEAWTGFSHAKPQGLQRHCVIFRRGKEYSDYSHFGRNN